MSDSQKLERIIEGLEAIAILSEQNLPVHDLAMECIRIAKDEPPQTLTAWEIKKRWKEE